jgi:hypothetical protein
MLAEPSKWPAEWRKNKWKGITCVCHWFLSVCLSAAVWRPDIFVCANNTWSLRSKFGSKQCTVRTQKLSWKLRFYEKEARSKDKVTSLLYFKEIDRKLWQKLMECLKEWEELKNHATSFWTPGKKGEVPKRISEIDNFDKSVARGSIRSLMHRKELYQELINYL